ncbi:putative glycerate dehydrogenase [Rosellinia necatrix]|uniref:Putative glycerate dehydrogenase n=1 Tax=Rosellinia necatrix TaxID=77044 RepID=A0A1W2TN99_ROSNE|nr:putative glycerate dehydrogenase [Rosellinia necatrix]
MIGSRMTRTGAKLLGPGASKQHTTTRNLATPARTPKLAIIDDYLGTSAPHFSHIPPSKLQVTTFKDTIVPLDEAEAGRLVERLRPFDLISTVRERTAFPDSLLAQLPNLRVLLAMGTQFERFDLEAARRRGVAVVAAPGLGRTDGAGPPPLRHDIRKGGGHPTTQHTWALLLALARNVARDDAALKAGGPAPGGGAVAWQTGLATGLTGLTLGVVGLGRLGAAVARIAHLAWGMRVVAWSHSLTQERADEMAVQCGLPADGGPDGSKTFRAVAKAELFASADVVSLHYVLGPRSRGLVGAAELARMKPSALLVNTSRGPLVDQGALVAALERGAIRGAAMDVFDVEPLPPDSPWRRPDYWGTHGRSDVLVTPHMGYVDAGLMNAWYAETAENVERWLEGGELLHRLV